MQRRNEILRPREPSESRVAGILLEEAVLYLLEASGYRTVLDDNNDSTLHQYGDKITVQGRGGEHQIDGIADFAIGQPFSHPQRLLVEAKFHGRIVDIGVVRNVVGVLQDVREYWSANAREYGAIRPKYHYVYAIFSASGYSSGAQLYAYAHDIYLIPLIKSAFIQPIITSIKTIKGFMLPSTRRLGMREELLVPYNESARGLRSHELRRYVRANIRNQDDGELSNIVNGTALTLLDNFCQCCRRLNGAILGMIAKQFPIFLVPGPDINMDTLRDCLVRIYWDDQGWYLHLSDGGSFSFDLPTELFKQYADHNILTETRALDLKADNLSEIQAVIRQGSQVRIVTFTLDAGWLNTIRDSIDRQQDR